MKTIFENVDAYIAAQEKTTQPLLTAIRQAIKAAAPDAEEVISYQMPAYKWHGVLVYFAGYKNHIGFYPSGSGIAHFAKALSIYKGAKGSVQFPLDKPMPLSLITKMVQFRIKENEKKMKEKGKKK
jgi:uncharacterized protein YdhG (YjbR/CyaY superfamily)